MIEQAALDFVVGSGVDDESGPFLASDSPQGRFHVVFEDDLETGYFYALDDSAGEDPIVDALHIYNVAQVTDRHIPSRASILWSDNGLVSVLLINGYAHAVFDFDRGRGWCRSGFPPPATTGPWVQESHDWGAEAEALLRP